MLDNAVAYYEHLVAQGMTSREAVEHAALRYGVRKPQMLARVGGQVAKHDETMAALSQARAALTGEKEPWELEVDPKLVLARLYAAVTGESL